jgi:hypothetical protein
MSGSLQSTPAVFWNYADCQTRKAGVPSSAQLEVNVLFTDREGTLAALSTAGLLAHELRAGVSLLAFQQVPLAFPLARPPVSIAFTKRRLRALADAGAQGGRDMSIHLFLCRDKRKAMLQALDQGSIVVIGRREGWWRRRDNALMRMLESKGLQIIPVTVK